MMKQIGMSLLILVVMASVSLADAGPASATDVVLARDGATPYVITLAPDATPPERHAAEELASFLKQVTGATFPLKTPAEAAGAPCLAVGPGAALALKPDLDLNGLGADGIIIRSLPGKCAHLLLTGGPGAPRGTLYAVYTFLEDEVGCRWWSKDESSIPSKPTLAVKSKLDVRYVPPLERRDQSFNEGMFSGDWAARNKFNGWCGPGHDEARGGSLEFAGTNNCHTFFSLVPPNEHFDKHPEWFSEVNGKRVNNGQLCLTNPELLQFLIGRVKEWLKTSDPNSAFVSVTQNDCAYWCTCPKCRAVDEAEGSQSGTMIRFVNAVAEAIEKDYPNVAVDTFAYQYTRKAPKLVRPRKNVVVRLCSIECDFARPMEDERNHAFRQDVEDWSRICDRVYIWDYAANFGHFLQAHPVLHVLGPNIRFLVRNNVKGIFEQGAYESPAPFGAMRAWVIGKLLWNPALDDQAIIQEFLDGYYGPAAPYLRRYIDLIHDVAAKSGFHMSIVSRADAAPYVASKVLEQSAALVAKAKAAVADRPEFLHRVEMVEVSILYSQILQVRDRGRQVLPLVNRFAAIARREKLIRISEGGAGDLNVWVQRIRREVLGQSYFDNSSGNGLWRTASNWSDDMVPVAGDDPYVGWTGGRTALIDSATAADAGNISVGYNGYPNVGSNPGTVKMTGGKVTAVGALTVCAGATGTWNQSGGVTTASILDVGRSNATNGGIGYANFSGEAHVIQNGDHNLGRKFNVGLDHATAYGVGKVTISDNALVEANWFDIGDASIAGSKADGHLDISGKGMLRINMIQDDAGTFYTGDLTKNTLLLRWISGGRITAYGGAGTVIVTYNSDLKRTELTASPRR